MVGSLSWGRLRDSRLALEERGRSLGIPETEDGQSFGSEAERCVGWLICQASGRGQAGPCCSPLQRWSAGK